MADIAAVFHWPLSELERLSWEALTRWREKARRRIEPEE